MSHPVPLPLESALAVHSGDATRNELPRSDIPLHQPTQGGARDCAPASLLEPLRTLQNPSLITSVFPIILGTTRREITKSLVLGKRSGGSPVRLSLLAGLDPGSTETIAAAVKLLMLFTLSPSLAEDYAVFGYPWVSLRGFEAEGFPPACSEDEVSCRKADAKAEALFFRAEFQRSIPHGIISLRSSNQSASLRARVNSAVIASEVVAPSLRRLANLLPVEENPVEVFSMNVADLAGDFLEHRLTPDRETKPRPFEIELEVPETVAFELKVQALVLATLDILKSYRAFACHGGEL